MTRPLVILDTETTSLRRDRRAWEVGMIRIDDRGETEIGAYVMDVDLSNADPASLNIGRFYDRHPVFGNGDFSSNVHHLEKEEDVASLVETWTRDALIVGAVPNFDTEVLADMLYRHKLCPAWHYHLTDVETLVAGWLCGVSARERDLQAMGYETPLTGREGSWKFPALPWKSEDLSRAIGVSPDDFDRHTALGDCRWILAQLRVVAPALIDSVSAGKNAKETGR